MAFSDGFRAGAAVRQARDSARDTAKQRNEELTKQGYSFDDQGNMSVRDNSAAQAEQLQASQAAMLAKSLQAKLAAQTTDNAFVDYAHTGDANYLQKALKDPTVGKAWQAAGIQMAGNVDFDNDQKLLSNHGITPAMYDTPEKKDILKKNFFKTYDGKDWSLNDTQAAVAKTGTYNRLGDRQGAVFHTNWDNVKNLILDHNRSIANAAKGTTNENVDQTTVNDTTNAGTSRINAQTSQADLVEKKREFDTTLPVRQQEATNTQNAITAKVKDGRTAVQKDLDAADESRTGLVSKFGDEESFKTTDFSDSKNFNKAYPDVIRIEKLTHTQLDDSQKKIISNVRGLINLGDPASKLDATGTGKVDNLLAKTKAALFDGTDGNDTKARTAYSAIRNVIRHDLYGSVLTPNEENAFNDVMAGLGSKQGTVLTQLRGQLDQTRTELESAASFMDPTVARVRLGKDQDRISAVLKNLDARIAKINGVVDNGGTNRGSAPVEVTPAKSGKEALNDSLFGGK